MSEKSKNEVEFREKLSFSNPILAREARRENWQLSKNQIKNTGPDGTLPPDLPEVVAGPAARTPLPTCAGGQDGCS